MCKIQSPSFFSLCKTYPHFYATGSLKLENSSQVSSLTTVDDDDVDHVNGLLNEGREEDCAVKEKKEEEEAPINEEILKSILKKAVLDSGDGEIMEKKKVQWVDVIGKELAEIRVFKSSKKDRRYGADQSCDCAIL